MAKSKNSVKTTKPNPKYPSTVKRHKSGKYRGNTPKTGK